MAIIEKLLGTNVIEQKKFTIEIIECGAFVEYAVVDQDKKRDLDFEKTIWLHLREFLGKKYGISKFELPDIYK